jgi:hypothetical protein
VLSGRALPAKVEPGVERGGPRTARGQKLPFHSFYCPQLVLGFKGQIIRGWQLEDQGMEGFEG